MLPNTLIQLWGFMGMCICGAFGIWKTSEAISHKWYEVKLKEIEADIAKSKENVLTASQIAEFLLQVNNTKSELEKVKEDNRRTDDHLFEAIESLEKTLDNLTHQFTSFLMAKALDKP